MASSGCATKFTAAPTPSTDELLNTEISNITKNDMQKITLNNGVEMPVMGYGVYQVAPDECERCVTERPLRDVEEIPSRPALRHNRSENRCSLSHDDTAL